MKYLTLLVVAATLSGCQLPFDRTYSLTVGDSTGRTVGASAKFSGTPLAKANKNVVPLIGE